MRMLSPGTNVLVDGVPCSIERHVGGGDYIVLFRDGQRKAVNGKSVTVAEPGEMERRTSPSLEAGTSEPLAPASSDTPPTETTNDGLIHLDLGLGEGIP